MGRQRRSAITAVIATVAVITVLLVPINWQSVQWGTVPEWIGAFSLLLIAVGVWRLVAVGRARDRSDFLR